jgi:hypothetical protein
MIGWSFQIEVEVSPECHVFSLTKNTSLVLLDKMDIVGWKNASKSQGS